MAVETERAKIVRRLEREGWIARRGGKHDVYTNVAKPETIIAIPASPDAVDRRRARYRKGRRLDLRSSAMTFYLGVVDPAADGTWGVVFPDLPGCYSAGDDWTTSLLTA